MQKNNLGKDFAVADYRKDIGGMKETDESKEEDLLVSEHESDFDGDTVMHGNLSTVLGPMVDDVLEDIVRVAVPTAKVLSNVGTEISFQLPIGASANFVSMFERLDYLIKEHKIETYGVSITTLDEVFLMVARGEEGLHLSTRPEGLQAQEKDFEPESTRRYRLSADGNERNAFKRHVRALLIKRGKNFKRDKKAW